MSKKNNTCYSSYYVILFLFIISLITAYYYYNVQFEGLDMTYECPEKLQKVGNSYRLYDGNNNEYTTLESLDDYIDLVKKQYSNDKFCPILTLDSSSELQGSSLTPSKDEKISLLLDANRNSSVYNINQFPSFDPMNQYIGTETPLDLLHKVEQGNQVSANPMDPNWGGNKYTNKVVRSGYYQPNTR